MGQASPDKGRPVDPWEQHPGQGQAQGVGATARRESICMEIGDCSSSLYGGQFVRGAAGGCKVSLDSNPEGGHPSSKHHPHRRRG